MGGLYSKHFFVGKMYGTDIFVKKLYFTVLKVYTLYLLVAIDKTPILYRMLPIIVF